MRLKRLIDWYLLLVLCHPPSPPGLIKPSLCLLKLVSRVTISSDLLLVRHPFLACLFSFMVIFANFSTYGKR